MTRNPRRTTLIAILVCYAAGLILTTNMGVLLVGWLGSTGVVLGKLLVVKFAIGAALAVYYFACRHDYGDPS